VYLILPCSRSVFVRFGERRSDLTERNILQRVDQLLSSYPSSPLPGTTTVQEVAQSLQLLVELYHDLNCQDFPEYFEDHNAEFMGDVALAGSGDPAGFGLLGKYLRWELPELMGSVSTQ
jgi:exportin-2 (importin alpha re-exporter)